MKKSFVLSAAALALTAALVFTGCSDPSDPPPDTTAPVLSAGSVSALTTPAGTTATLKFTSDEAGTYYYVVLASGDSAPDAATVKAQGTAVAKGTAAATASENTISVTGLTASSTYKAYIVVEDAEGNTSAVLTIDGVNPVGGIPDTTAPVLSAGSVSALTTPAGTTATLKFTSDEAGTYYYVVLASGAAAPNAATVKAQGTAVAKGTAAATTSENTISVTGLTAATTYKAYIVVTDASANDSAVLTIDGVNPVAVTYAIGDTGPAGGKIIYTAGTGGWKYLEAAPTEISVTKAWASSGFQITNIPGTSTGIGTGKANTITILAVDPNAPAAKACKEYTGGGKTDWFLPSLYELMFTNSAVGGFITNNYWTSSQSSSNFSWRYDPSGGGGSGVSKSGSYYVRPVRAF